MTSSVDVLLCVATKSGIPVDEPPKRLDCQPFETLNFSTMPCSNAYPLLRLRLLSGGYTPGAGSTVGGGVVFKALTAASTFG